MMQTPTTPENIAKIDALSKKIEEKLAYLWGRWQDEKEYEDIEDYGKAIAKELPEGFKMVKMTKRPFGFQFTLDGSKYSITCTSRTMGWKRL